MKTSVEFEYSVGDKVKIIELNNAVGFVTSLWFSDRGIKYEVTYYCASNRSDDYFYSQEIQLFTKNDSLGFNKKEKE